MDKPSETPERTEDTEEEGIGTEIAQTHTGACQHPAEETCQNCRTWWGSVVSRNDL